MFQSNTAIKDKAMRFSSKALLIAVAALVCTAFAGRLAQAELSGQLRIDARETREPISKHVYGQFIEQLGRCIDGGIWAEMVDDRKFYHGVREDASPWQPITEGGSVRMTKNKPYVGEHSPVIALEQGDGTAGIRQKGFGLEDGMSYEGRIILRGASSAAPVTVTLAWGDGDDEKDTVTIEKLTPHYMKRSLTFTSEADTHEAVLRIEGHGSGTVQVGTLSLMPADNINGMRADTMKLLEELNAPSYRWPGGNFVSGYDWRDGIGARDRRPPRPNPAWKGIESNDFGLDEFITFCRYLDAEPIIVVNSGFGDAHSAAEEVQYINGAADTPMGRLRAQNGHPEPYDVTFWGIGNEMYGDWQLGHMALDQYVRKHNRFARAMRNVDPDIRLVGVGSVGDWSKGMLKNCTSTMDLLSEHFYLDSKKDVPAHVQQMPDKVRSICEAHRKYRENLDALQNTEIPITIDEWNYWGDRSYVYGELGIRYYLKDALGVAAGLHEMFRNSDLVKMANYAQTVNVLGATKTSKTDACFASTGLTLKLYRNQYGRFPVKASTDTEDLHVAAAWTGSEDALTIAVVNPLQEDAQLDARIQGASLTGEGHRWHITGPEPMSYNVPGEEPNVRIMDGEVNGASTLNVPALSVCLYRLETE
ncbi:MAG: alpha-L-arabinofuranosidase C-terminal domain-containing protein [Planctomycetota bacterium]